MITISCIVLYDCAIVDDRYRNEFTDNTMLKLLPLRQWVLHILVHLLLNITTYVLCMIVRTVSGLEIMSREPHFKCIAPNTLCYKNATLDSL